MASLFQPIHLHQFSFAGQRAATANHTRLSQAQERAARGDDAETIRRETGWHTGADGQWRFEIDDHAAGFNTTLLSNLRGGGFSDRRIESVSYRRDEDSTYQLCLTSVAPKKVSDFVTIRAIPEAMVKALISPEAWQAIERGDGEEDLIGVNLDDAKRVQVAFDFTGFNALPLDAVMDHPALFAAYPALRSIMVAVDPKLTNGASLEIRDYVDGTSGMVIRIGNPALRNVERAILHEIQHAVQNLEGFAPGGAPSQFKTVHSDEVAAILRRELRAAQRAKGYLSWFEQMPDVPTAAQQKAIDKVQAARRAVKQFDDTGEDPRVLTATQQYFQLAGEVEARNVERRRALNAEERQQTPPEATEDVPRAKQAVTSNGTSLMLSFAGEQAQTADLPSLAAAQARIEAGKAARAQIRNLDKVATGEVSERWAYNHLGAWSNFDDETGETFVRALRAAGYDSVVFNDTNPATDEAVTSTVVLDPEQIKSAIGNRGTFDPQSPNISHLQPQAATEWAAPGTQVETTAFKQWFASSKAVDANGEPLVLYHGSDLQFTKFRTASWEGGAFFTSNKEAAHLYGDHLYEVHLSMQNPLEVSAKDWVAGNVLNDDSAKVEGYDGYIIRNHDVGGEPDQIMLGDTYVAFYAEQIKSATDNNGQFDASNPDIRFSLADTVEAPAVDQVQTEAFQDWFGTSKVVDSSGAPLVMYHGTTETNYVPGTTQAGSASARAELERMALVHGIKEWNDVPAVMERWLERGQAERFGVTVQVAEHARELQRQARATTIAPSRVDLGFSVFDMPGAGKELGAHFGTKNQALARGAPFAFYLQVENPLRLPDLGTWDYQSVMREARRRGVAISEGEYDQVFNARDSNEALRHLFQAKGYDGVVYENEAEGRGDSWIVFRPEQIKSAGGNNGQFDRQNPDIRFSFAASEVVSHPAVQTQTKAFQDWFSGSKIVGDDDRPLVVYHGTTLPDIEKDGDFFFFASSSAEAARYAPDNEVGARVVPAYLSLKNPLVVETEMQPAEAWDTQGQLYLESALAGGHDAVVTVQASTGDKNYMVFRPEQFQRVSEMLADTDQLRNQRLFAGRAVGNTLAESLVFGHAARVKGNIAPERVKEEIMFSHSPQFFSQLERSIEEAPAKIATLPADQWSAWLLSSAPRLGIKKDELEWSGVLTYLATREKQKVTRGDLLSYLDENGVRAGETMLQGAKPPERLTPEYADDSGTWIVVDEEGAVIADDLASRRDAAQWIDDHHDDFKAGAKYEQYVLPGGENYREVLITLPRRGVTTGDVAQRLFGMAMANLSEAQRDDVSSEMRRIGDSAQRDFKSGHFDDLNILVHLRVDDRVDAQGKKTLMIHEIQSDWGQSGKKTGFAGTVDAVLKYNKMTREEFNSMEESSKSFALKETNNSTTIAPNGPFVTDTKAWVGLAIKRAAMLAVQDGYDRVSFITGEQAARLYDLSNQAESISVEANLDGTYDIGVELEESNMHYRNQTPQEVEATIGKELAEQGIKAADSWLEANKAYRAALRLSGVAESELDVLRDAREAIKREFSGVERKIGGEGLITFYDKIVPQVAREVLKKLDGNLTSVPFGPKANGKFGVFDVAEGTLLFSSDSERDADEYCRVYAGLAQVRPIGIAGDVHGFDITPAMRLKVLAGTPQFSRVPLASQEREAHLARMEAFLDADTAFGNLQRAQTQDLQRILQAHGRATRGHSLALDWSQVPVAEREAYFGREQELLQHPEHAEYAKLAAALPDDGTPRASKSSVASVRAAIGKLVNDEGVLGQCLGSIVACTAAEITTKWKTVFSTSPQASEQASRAQGFYAAASSTIFLITDNIAAGDELGVVAHELMHKHGKAILGTDGWAQLHGAIEGWSRATPGSQERAIYAEAVRRVTASKRADADSAVHSSQELFPYAVEVALRMGVQPSWEAPKDSAAGWLARVRSTLCSVWEKVTSKPKEMTASDLVTLAYGIAHRERVEHEVDGVRDADSPLSSASFKAWFSGSKAVDAAGAPLVLYHGTKAEFNSFDYAKIGTNGRAEGAGFYFTDNISVASQYGKLMPVYLALRKPLAYDAKAFGRTLTEKLVRRIAVLQTEMCGILMANSFLSNYADVDHEGLRAAIREATKSLLDSATAVDQLSDLVSSGVPVALVNQACFDVTGHDGIVSNGFSNCGDDDTNIFVAFFPEQIKSASGNCGQYDGNTPNIYHSLPLQAAPATNHEQPPDYDSVETDEQSWERPRSR